MSTNQVYCRQFFHQLVCILCLYNTIRVDRLKCTPACIRMFVNSSFVKICYSPRTWQQPTTVTTPFSKIQSLNIQCHRFENKFLISRIFRQFHGSGFGCEYLSSNSESTDSLFSVLCADKWIESPTVWVDNDDIVVHASSHHTVLVGGRRTALR